MALQTLSNSLRRVFEWALCCGRGSNVQEPQPVAPPTPSSRVRHEDQLSNSQENTMGDVEENVSPSTSTSGIVSENVGSQSPSLQLSECSLQPPVGPVPDKPEFEALVATGGEQPVHPAPTPPPTASGPASVCQLFTISPHSSSLSLTLPCPLYEEEDFDGRVDINNVLLEYCIHGGNDLTGYVRVKNLAYQKYVGVRFTQDDWASFQEVPAKFLSSEEGRTDRFVFDLPSKSLSTIEFALRYNVNGCDHWDNNKGSNYQIVF